MTHLLSFIHTPNFTAYLEEWSYFGVFIWFTIFDFVAPFPDELSLLTLGYLSSIGVLNPFIAGAVAFISFIGTDSLSFFFVRKGSTLFFGGKKAKAHSFRGYVAKRLEKNLPGTIIAISFIPRMRIWGPIVAGSTRKTSYRKFITFDAIGVGLFTAVYTSLGYFFGASFSSIFKELKSMQGSIFVGVLLILGIILIFISAKVEKNAK